MLSAISPMALAALSDDPMFQLAKAWRYNQIFVGRPDTMLERRPSARKIGTGQRLRIGYLSSDLREHAVGFALSEEDSQRLLDRLKDEKLELFYIKVPLEMGFVGKGP